MEARNMDEINRTKEIQNQAISEIESRMQACKQALEEFKSLEERVTTLPQKMSHEIMVPFGKYAFMPGKIVHTNEMLVHLGDSWFATMTCSQALKTIGRRKERLDATITDLKKVASNIEKKKEFIGELENESIEKRDVVEIKEEVPADYQHPKDHHRISRVKDNENREKMKYESTDEELTELKTDESSNRLRDDDAHTAMLKRLDELERLEQEEDEFCRISDSDDEPSSGILPPEEQSCTSSGKTPKRVKWRGDDIDSKETLTDIKQIKYDNVPQDSATITIKFRHSNVAPHTSREDELTPADIHKQIRKPTPKKSILKKTSNKPTKQNSTLPSKEIIQSRILTQQQTAISDVVVERSSVSQLNGTKMQSTSPQSLPSKPVSRFKSGRKKS